MSRFKSRPIKNEIIEFWQAIHKEEGANVEIPENTTPEWWMCVRRSSQAHLRNVVFSLLYLPATVKLALSDDLYALLADDRDVLDELGDRVQTGASLASRAKVFVAEPGQAPNSVTGDSPESVASAVLRIFRADL